MGGGGSGRVGTGRDMSGVSRVDVHGEVKFFENSKKMGGGVGSGGSAGGQVGGGGGSG